MLGHRAGVRQEPCIACVTELGRPEAARWATSREALRSKKRSGKSLAGLSPCGPQALLGASTDPAPGQPGEEMGSPLGSAFQGIQQSRETESGARGWKPTRMTV